MMSSRHERAGQLAPPSCPGLSVDDQGRGTFAVAAPRAEAVDLCIRRGGAEHRQRLRHVDGGLHWDVVTDMVPGTRYGLRASGPFAPERGLMCSPKMLLADPYARGISHSSPLLSTFYPFEVTALLDRVGDEPRQTDVDNADSAVWSVVVGERFDWQGDLRPLVDWDDTVIYEAHVKGLTQLHPRVPEAQRGTYAGLAHPAVTSYLRDLGVTTVELLPIHAAMDEPHLTRLGLTNYWGYSTLSYFAPEPSYATTAAQRAGAQAVVDEVKEMVRSLHEAGLEVVLDVVYNHTAEGGADGPSLSFRGLDNLEYYWNDHGTPIDMTGTGGTLDPRSVHVVDLVLASLRYWVEEMHVDGFRFDLAATLGRDDRGFRPDHPLLRAIVTDPVLRRTKLIAEPWDVGPGGWQTGSFPHPFAEWNDAFRDDLRSFWLEGRGRAGIRDLATRLSASSDVLRRHDPDGLPPGRSLRSPSASINYVTAHDGFTLHDLVAYERKHNLDNGEDNRDGTTNNRSWNHGVEGETDDPAISAARRRSVRSILATLLLASGTPMLTAGDESGRTQRGNNNAYCQDNDISWVSWDHSRHDCALHEMVRDVLRLRAAYPQLRPPTFLAAADPAALGPDQVAWFGADGEALDHDDWMDPGRNLLAMLRPGAGGDEGHLLVIVSAHDHATDVALPGAPWPQGRARVIFDSALENQSALSEAPLGDRRTSVAGGSVVVVRIAAPNPVS